MTNGLLAFARAVGWGTLAGAAPFIALLFIPIALEAMGAGEIGEIAILLVWPMLLSGALVLGSAVLFGLPLTAVLSASGREEGGIYAVTGLILGVLVPIAVIAMMGGAMDGELLYFAPPGAFAGLVTGTSWGRWREALNR